jgi:hypothetical protein
LPRPSESACAIGVSPTTSRIALSAADLTVASGARILKRYDRASLIIQNTAKLMSTMFSSPVSINASSGT